MVKLLQQIINTRLKWFLETEKQLSGTQEIKDGFQCKKQTFSVWIDLQKVFDKAWTDGLLLKLRTLEDVTFPEICSSGSNEIHITEEQGLSFMITEARSYSSVLVCHKGSFIINLLYSIHE